MSPLPISRSALDRLGERLAASDEISETDYELLLSVLTAYQAALDETRDRLTRLGYAPTTRVKTTSVLIEKLRRESGMKLKGVQDIAGARIVADIDRHEQDAIVARIVHEFADASRAPKVKDRRAEPMAGYRAVHVIVTVHDVPVEIQVRTQRQDQWAQIAESLGDKWGRGLRYGAGPDDPKRPILPGNDLTRLRLWHLVLAVAEAIEALEQARELLGIAGGILDRVSPEKRTDPEYVASAAETEASLRRLGAAEGDLREALAFVRKIAERVE